MDNAKQEAKTLGIEYHVNNEGELTEHVYGSISNLWEHGAIVHNSLPFPPLRFAVTLDDLKKVVEKDTKSLGEVSYGGSQWKVWVKKTLEDGCLKFQLGV